MTRTRTYSWADPQAQDKASRDCSGLEFLRLLASGEIGRTPMMATLRFAFTAVAEGRVEMECVPDEFMYNPIGVVHGGLAASLLDSVAGSAVHTLLPAGTGYTTLDLSTRFLRPVTGEAGTLRAVGTVVSRGRRTALATAELRDASERLLAHATSACMIFVPDRS
jgi:uncharacterized protein (TIGR00369 family)